MKILALTVLVILVMCAAPRDARADATVFLGTTTSTTPHRSVKGFAAGVSLLIVGFEFEYAGIAEDPTTFSPSLKTTSGNVFLQTFGLHGFQLYATTGSGFYRERLGTDQETSLAFNTGGGAKISLLGPLRARVDYRIFNLRGNPQHSKVQRLYVGANLAF